MDLTLFETFDESDWDCFSGAEGDNPKIMWEVKVIIDKDDELYERKDLIDWVIIIDELGINIHGFDYHNSDNFCYSFWKTKSQKESEIFVKENISYPIKINNLIGLGFQRTL